MSFTKRIKQKEIVNILCLCVFKIDHNLLIGKIYKGLSSVGVKSRVDTYTSYDDAIEWLHLH